LTQGTLQTCLCIELRGTAQKLTKLYDEALSLTGITVTQFSLLHKVQLLGHPTINALAKATGLDRSTLGRNLRRLHHMNLVEMRTGADARSKTILITDRGRNDFERAVPLWQSVQSSLEKRLGEDKRALLTELLADLNVDPVHSPCNHS